MEEEDHRYSQREVHRCRHQNYCLNATTWLDFAGSADSAGSAVQRRALRQTSGREDRTGGVSDVAREEKKG